jgi:hypothetical protein
MNSGIAIFGPVKILNDFLGGWQEIANGEIFLTGSMFMADYSQLDS